MIQNAKEVERIAKDLQEILSKSFESDGLLFLGKVLAGPILLTLAVEIALKACLLGGAIALRAFRGWTEERDCCPMIRLR